MDKVASFSVDHTQLKAGVYVSRTDTYQGVCVTTFDVRLVSPYTQPPLTAGALHTIEHLGAVYLREHSSWAERILYWGPMGCQTGFDFLVFGDVTAKEAVPLLKDTFAFIAHYQGEIPGAHTAAQCGNYRLHDLPQAQEISRHFVRVLENWQEPDSQYPRLAD